MSVLEEHRRSVLAEAAADLGPDSRVTAEFFDLYYRHVLTEDLVQLTGGRVLVEADPVKAADALERTILAKRLSGTGMLTTVFAGLIFVVAAYMLWKSAAAL